MEMIIEDICICLKTNVMHEVCLANLFSKIKGCVAFQFENLANGADW